MLDPVRLAELEGPWHRWGRESPGNVEPHWPRDDGVPVSRLSGELDAVIGRDRVDTVADGVRERLRDLPNRFPVGLLDLLRHGELARSVNADECKELSFDSLHFGDVYVEGGGEDIVDGPAMFRRAR